MVRASARGARNLKSRNASATQLLSYSRLSLYKGREKYIIDDAQPIQVFFDLRSDLEKLALAQYFCELRACWPLRRTGGGYSAADAQRPASSRQRQAGAPAGQGGAGAAAAGPRRFYAGSHRLFRLPAV